MRVLLVSFLLAAAVLLFGAEVNAVIEHHAGAGKDPGEKRLPPRPAQQSDRPDHGAQGEMDQDY